MYDSLQNILLLKKKNVLRLLYESKKELWEVWKNCGLFYCYNLPDIYRSARSKKKKKKEKEKAQEPHGGDGEIGGTDSIYFPN